MAQVIEGESIRLLYPIICQEVVLKGRRVAPRGKPTYELDDVVIVVHDPRDSLPTGTGRRVVPAIGILEALQLISGESAPELLIKISPHFQEFMQYDDANNLYQHGAYGKRVGAYMPKVVDLLRRDPDTRQALVNIWQADKDVDVETPDVPCTCTIRFAIRDDVLNCTTVMRSNDVWLGLAYDAFQFTQLQLTVARSLGCEVGTYTHHAMSLHAYARDADKIANLALTDERGDMPFDGVGNGAGRPWASYRDRASLLLGGWVLTDATPHEKIMVEILNMYR